MDKQAFLHLFSLRVVDNAQDVQGLEQARRQYPWAALVHWAHAKVEQERHSPQASEAIRKASVYSLDRGHLKQFLEGSRLSLPAELPNPEPAAVAQPISFSAPVSVAEPAEWTSIPEAEEVEGVHVFRFVPPKPVPVRENPFQALESTYQSQLGEDFLSELQRNLAEFKRNRERFVHKLAEVEGMPEESFHYHHHDTISEALAQLAPGYDQVSEAPAAPQPEPEDQSQAQAEEPIVPPKASQTEPSLFSYARRNSLLWDSFTPQVEEKSAVEKPKPYTNGHSQPGASPQSTDFEEPSLLFRPASMMNAETSVPKVEVTENESPADSTPSAEAHGDALVAEAQPSSDSSDIGYDFDTEAPVPLDEQKKIIEQFIAQAETLAPMRENASPATENKDLSAASTQLGVDLVTENMAILYTRQGKTDKALHIYQQLLLKNPEKKAYFEAQIELLKNS